MWKQVSEPKLELLTSNPECDCLDAHVTSVGLPTATDTPFSLGKAFQASDIRLFPFPCLIAVDEDLADVLNCFIEMEVMYRTIHPFKACHSMVFSMCPAMCSITTVGFSTFSSPQEVTPSFSCYPPLPFFPFQP